jgi:hypothetical protein
MTAITTTAPRSALIAAAAIPLAAAIGFVLAFGVDVPFHDEWNMIDGVARAFDGKLSLHDLWTPHNEHVAFFDHVVIVTIARLTRWNLRAQMLASVLVSACALVLFAWSLRRTPGVPAWSVALASGFVFSLHARENWLWGGQVQLAITVFGAAGALTLLGVRALRWPALAAAILLALVASWSFLAGFLLWPIGAALLAVRPFTEPGSRTRAVVPWLASAAVAIGVPLVTYPARSFTASAGFAPGRILDFVACYVGAGLIGPTSNAAAARLAGGAGLAVLVLGGAWVAYRRRASPAVLALWSIGLFGLGTGFMIALGRGTTSVIQAASSSRYASFSGLCWIVAAVIPWLAADRATPAFRALRGAFAIAIGATLLATQPARVAEAREIARKRTEAAQALRTGEGMSLDVLEGAFAQPADWLPHLHGRLATLRRLGLSLFREATPSELAPESRRAPFTATLMLAKGGPRAAAVEARGGVPGNVAIAVFTRDLVPVTVPMTLDATGSAAGTIDVGPDPIPANATFTVFSLDRAGRIIQCAPAPTPR